LWCSSNSYPIVSATQLLCPLTSIHRVTFQTSRIIFRAFQGAGGGATYTLCNIIGYELVPDSQIPVATGIIAAIFGITLATGPIIGGAISRAGQWRWVFLLNVPAVVPAVLILLYYLPSSFPNHGKPGQPVQARNIRGLFTTKNLARVDLIGVAMIWLGILALASGLEEAGISHGWSSAFVIAMLVVGGILILGFFGWERFITQKAGVTEPVFPWHFATNRVVAGLLL
jgi:MFS family permease